MKKLFFFLVAVMLLYTTAMTQVKNASYQKGHIHLAAGPSFPLGDFNSKDIFTDHAGFAKVGFNIELQGGYQLTKNLGVGGSLFYSYYSLDQQKLKEQLVEEGFPGEVGISMDHWQYYGIVVGPIITRALSAKTTADFHLMTGVARANSPKTTINLESVNSSSPEDWATAVPLRVGAGLRFQFANMGYLFTGVNYTYMDPDFEFTADGETFKTHQPISTLNVNAGIGFRF